MIGSVRLRSERFDSEFLDPRRQFEPTHVSVEVRWDPLTGHSSRLLPEDSIPPPARHDLASLADQTRPTCPFCRDALARETPRFPSALWEEGRIEIGEAVLFPNLVPYSKWSSVSVYSSDRHLLPIEQITTPLLRDNLAAQIEFEAVVHAHDPSCGWMSINANHLPPSGSSIFHPHLQGSANPVPSTMQRLHAELADRTIDDYLELERDGPRHIRSAEGVEWIAAFAPIGPAEVRAFVPNVLSPTQLNEGMVDELARGIVAALAAYADLGYQSFNLAIYGAPETEPRHMLSLRLVARAYFGPLMRSDAMWSERLHWEAATDIAPERAAELMRKKLAGVDKDLR